MMTLPPSLQLAMNYLTDHATAGATVAEAARRAGISPPWLTRLFRKHIGKTPTRHLLEVRVKAAGAMLSAGESLVRAAGRAGFSDQAHMTRAFKRVCGQTPAKFVRGARKNVQDCAS